MDGIHERTGRIFTSFDQVTTLAEQMNTPRSRLIARALELFVRQYESHQMNQQLDAAYGDEVSDDAERELVRRQRRSHRKLVEGQW